MERKNEIIEEIEQHFDQRRGARFECDEGWLPLLGRLHEQLKALVPNYTLLQVKEKFGGLRYYTSLDSVDEQTAEQFYGLIHAAEEESYKICERCGQPGKLSQKGYWYKTLCSTCRSQLGFAPMSDRQEQVD